MANKSLATDPLSLVRVPQGVLDKSAVEYLEKFKKQNEEKEKIKKDQNEIEELLNKRKNKMDITQTLNFDFLTFDKSINFNGANQIEQKTKKTSENEEETKIKINEKPHKSMNFILPNDNQLINNMDFDKNILRKKPNEPLSSSTFSSRLNTKPQLETSSNLQKEQKNDSFKSNFLMRQQFFERQSRNLNEGPAYRPINKGKSFDSKKRMSLGPGILEKSHQDEIAIANDKEYQIEVMSWNNSSSRERLSNPLRSNPRFTHYEESEEEKQELESEKRTSKLIDFTEKQENIPISLEEFKNFIKSPEEGNEKHLLENKNKIIQSENNLIKNTEKKDENVKKQKNDSISNQDAKKSTFSINLKASQSPREVPNKRDSSEEKLKTYDIKYKNNSENDTNEKNFEPDYNNDKTAEIERKKSFGIIEMFEEKVKEGLSPRNKYDKNDKQKFIYANTLSEALGVKIEERRKNSNSFKQCKENESEELKNDESQTADFEIPANFDVNKKDETNKTFQSSSNSTDFNVFSKVSDINFTEVINNRFKIFEDKNRKGPDGNKFNLNLVDKMRDDLNIKAKEDPQLLIDENNIKNNEKNLSPDPNSDVFIINPSQKDENHKEELKIFKNDLLMNIPLNQETKLTENKISDLENIPEKITLEDAYEEFDDFYNRGSKFQEKIASQEELSDPKDSNMNRSEDSIDGIFSSQIAGRKEKKVNKPIPPSRKSMLDELNSKFGIRTPQPTTKSNVPPTVAPKPNIFTKQKSSLRYPPSSIKLPFAKNPVIQKSRSFHSKTQEVGLNLELCAPNNHLLDLRAEKEKIKLGRQTRKRPPTFYQKKSENSKSLDISYLDEGLTSFSDLSLNEKDNTRDKQKSPKIPSISPILKNENENLFIFDSNDKNYDQNFRLLNKDEEESTI